MTDETSPRQREPRPLMILIAVAFLFESWVWQGCIGIGRRLVALFPWARIKARVAAFVAILPAPAALLVFLIPVAVIEPMKVICLALMAHHHFFLGVLGFIALKFIGFGLIAVVFDLTRDKLLAMPWFVWIYERIVAFHDYAHRLVAPYKAVVLDDARRVANWARTAWSLFLARRARSGRSRARM